jgi:hypothetical protein
MWFHYQNVVAQPKWLSHYSNENKFSRVNEALRVRLGVRVPVAPLLPPGRAAPRHLVLLDLAAPVSAVCKLLVDRLRKKETKIEGDLGPML